MQAKATPSTRLDGIDLQRFQEMVDSQRFKIFTARITSELKRAEEALVVEKDDVTLRRAQGVVMALRTVLTLPSQLISEMKHGARSK